jgi:hypothetical protein
LKDKSYESQMCSFTGNVVYRQKLNSPYKPNNIQAPEGQSTITLVFPWPKVYQQGVGFVEVGEGDARVCRTPSAWHVFVGITNQ